MALTEGKDFVFAPKATYVWNGVNYVSVVGTRKYLFLITKENISGAGSTVETIKVNFGGKRPEEALKMFFASPEITVEELENTLIKMVGGDRNFYLEIPKLAEFNIKNGWFSRGVYWKTPGERGFSGVGVSGKDYVAALQNFYGKNN